jgi:subtilisin family serine protease
MPATHQLIQLSSLDSQSGRPRIAIGIIDGPVNTSHPDFAHATIKVVNQEGPSVCAVAGSPACVHGTFTAGVLCAGSASVVPGIYPEALLISRPLFCEAQDLNQCPRVTPEGLAGALHEVLGAGAHVVNLSLGLAAPVTGRYDILHKAFTEAQRRGVIVVGASGNQGRIGHNPLFDHPWVIPVAACDERGHIIGLSNIGPSVGTRGVMAPGKNIKGVKASGGYLNMTGTSVAAPFVSGAAARLRALYPQADPRLIRDALLGGRRTRRTVIPPLLNLMKSKAYIESNL